MCRALWVVQLVGAHGQVPAWLQQTQISVAAFYAKVGLSRRCLLDHRKAISYYQCTPSM